MDESSATGGFETLADETRMRVLEALADAGRESSSPELEFAELRRAVGMRDSGNFSYHLDRLVGRFVERTDDGYALTPAGTRVVAAVRAGRYDDAGTAGPVAVEGACAECGAGLSATYEEGVLRVACDNDHVAENLLAPSALEDRTLPEAAGLLGLRSQHDIEMARRHGCPYCYGAIEWKPAGDDNALAGSCVRCGVDIRVPVGALVADHPAVVALYHAHEVDVREQPLWELPFCAGDAVERVDDDPPRWQVTVEVGDDAVALFVDADADVTLADDASA